MTADGGPAPDNSQNAAGGAKKRTISAEETLNVGDLVLVHCNITALDDAAETQGQPGYVRATGLNSEVVAIPMDGDDSFKGKGVDVRDYLFVVVDQLTYTAQKDLKRLKKYTEKVTAGHESQLNQLKTLETRAKEEDQRNSDIASKRAQKPLVYGSIVQLQHLRTKQFLCVRPKEKALLNKTFRRIGLESGSVKSWMRINPFFHHKTQGEPVAFNDQVSLEFAKLSGGWNMNWSRSKDQAKDETFEINCAKVGQGFCFVPYSRSVFVEPGRPGLALNYGLPLCFYMPHYSGYLAASSSQDKNIPYLRRSADERIPIRYNSKDIWILEVVSTSFRDFGIEFNTSPVMLRHFGSGKYLALSEYEAVNEGLLLSEGDNTDLIAIVSPTSRRVKSGASFSDAMFMSLDGEQVFDGRVAAELVDVPGVTSLFVLEPDTKSRGSSAHSTGNRMWVPCDETCVMLRWDHSTHNIPMWLSSMGAQKGSRQSFDVYWSNTRFPRNALRLEMTPESDMLERDVVVEHRNHLTSLMKLFPRCKEAHVAAMCYHKCEAAISDMILFLADMPTWRSDAVQARHQDALQVAWRSTPYRQQLLRELRYVDVTFTLLEELVRLSPGLTKEIDFAKRVSMKEDDASALGGQDKIVLDSGQVISIPALLARVLKLVVRLWVFCFLGSREAEDLFYKRGWMEKIDGLNGHGVGASDVFVALVRDNPTLVRKVTDETTVRFIDFIRVLGPLDTWLNFLIALCAPGGQAVSARQQSVCCVLIFAGHRNTAEKRQVAQRNKQELLVSFRLDDPVGRPLCAQGGPASRPDPSACLGSRTVAEGIHEIAISWKHPQKWAVGQGVLYHGPDALNLTKLQSRGGKDKRSWVSMAQVVWVLQPQRCCELVTGISWKDYSAQEEQGGGGLSSNWRMSSTGGIRSKDSRDPFESTGFNLLRMLAKYIYAQLRLAAALAKERQMNCIMALQEEYSFSLCLNGAADQRLPSAIRGSFFDLLTDLWLDRHPHSQLVIPQLLRSLPEKREGVAEPPTFTLGREQVPDSWSPEHFRALPDEVRAFYRLSSYAKMDAVVQAVRSHLCAGPEVEQLVHSAFEDNMMMQAVLRNLSFLMRFGFVKLASVLELLGPLLRCLDGRTDWLDFPTAKQAASASEGKNGAEDAPGGRPTEVAPLLEGTSVLPNAENGNFTKARFPPLEKSAQRYVISSDNKAAHIAKVQTAQVVEQMVEFGMEMKLAYIVQKFNEFKDGSGSLAREVLRIVDKPYVALEQPRIRSPNIMLIDLAMYEDADLFATALQLLLANSLTTEDLLEQLELVRLINPQQNQFLERLRLDMEDLGKLIYAFENWGVDDNFSGVETNKLGAAKKICESMREVCREGHEGISREDIQAMLCQTEFFSHVMYSLKLNPLDYQWDCRGNLTALTGCLCGAAVMFIRDNPSNQTMMMEAIPYAEKLFDEVPESALLVAEVFRNNLELCQQLSEHLISGVGDLIKRERRAGHFVPWYINFFCCIVTAGQQPVPRNQVLVVETMKRITPKAMLRLGKEMSAKHLQQLAANFKSPEQLSDLAPSRWKSADGELIYYIYCLDLCAGLATGQSSHSMMLKPYVNSLFPVSNAMRLLMVIEVPALAHGFSIHRHLRTRWLRILCLVLYDVDTHLIDTDLLTSPIHCEFMGLLLEWLAAALGLPSANEAQRAAGTRTSASWNVPDVESHEEDYLNAMLACVDGFFRVPFHELKNLEFAQGLIRIAKTYQHRLSGPIRSNLEKVDKLPIGEMLQITAHRVAAAFGDPSAAQTRLLQTEQRVRTTSVGTTVQAQWKEMVREVRADPDICRRVEDEVQQLGRVVVKIEQYTDPDDNRYLKQMPTELHGSLPDGWDFRRCKILLGDVLRRFVKHVKTHLVNDLPSLRRLQKMFLAMLTYARSASDPAILPWLQAQFVQAGVTELIVCVLDARISTDISATSWKLLTELLHGATDSEDRVNKAVQSGLFKAITGMDDSGLWDSFSEAIEAVGNSTKQMRALKFLPSLTEKEQLRLEEYRERTSSAIIALEAMRLLVEGHDHAMQDYLFSQVGNSRSVNVLETACMLLVRLCKDASAADLAEEQEFECMVYILSLLTELAQGPNLRNQEHLSTLGLVETVFKLLTAGFVQIQRAAGDLYPSAVRQLKAQLVSVLLALLEGRQDNRIHTTLLQRIDLQVLRERIVFVNLYFIFGTLSVSRGRVKVSGTSNQHVAVRLDGFTQRLLLPIVDQSELYYEREEAEQVAFELLEDLDDDELDECFSEGLNLIQLGLELAPHSAELVQEVVPQRETFADDPSLYTSERDFQRQKYAFHKRENYAHSYSFLRQFVKTIEVVLNGHLQNLHFQQPLTAMFYMQETSKQRILDKVPFRSPDVKNKAFILMSQEVHEESKLIRQLSKFSIVPQEQKKWAQMNLPDGAHRPFQIFLSNDARRMQQLLRGSLILSLALAFHTGTFLVPVAGAAGGGAGPPVRRGVEWSSSLTQRVAMCLGCLYVASTLLWVALTACIRVPLESMSSSLQDVHASTRRARALLNFLSKGDMLWRILLLLWCTIALVSEHQWLYSFLVADFFCQSSRLATVLGGVIAPLRSLAMTSLGATIVSFAYASVGFHYFRGEFGDYCKDNVIICTQNIIYQSTRNGIIGLSSMMETVMPEDTMWTERMMYDISFFMVTGVMLLNTVVALIVDSFGSQRIEKEEREANRESETFISCLDRKMIEAVAQAAGISDGFNYHETYKQHKWDYMSFIFYLREKHVQDYTGPEQSIRSLVEKKDIKWIPIGRSKLLEEDQTHINEDVIGRIEHSSKRMVQEMEGGVRVKSLIASQISGLTRNLDERMDAMQQQLAALQVWRSQEPMSASQAQGVPRQGSYAAMNSM